MLQLKPTGVLFYDLDHPILREQRFPEEVTIDRAHLKALPKQHWHERGSNVTTCTGN
jgi:hypothetical protein